MREAVQKARLKKAIAILMAFALLIPLGKLLVELGTPLAVAQAPSPGLSASELLGSGRDARAVLERAEQLVSTNNSELPEAFKNEIGLPGGYRDLRAENAGLVVGCTVDAGPRETLSSIRLQMLGRGWREVPLGEIAGSTFVKNFGACRWTLVTCTQIGAATSVVYRCVYQ